jgi:hypothetical protein
MKMKTKYEKPVALNVQGSTAGGDGVDSCFSGSIAQGTRSDPGACLSGNNAQTKNCHNGTHAAGGACTPGAAVYACFQGLSPAVYACIAGGGN